MTNDAQKRAKARQKALSDLGRKHRDEYRDLYQKHLSGVGLAPEADSAVSGAMIGAANPELFQPKAFGDCEHLDKESIDGVTTCKDCGGTRPYFSWLPPE